MTAKARGALALQMAFALWAATGAPLAHAIGPDQPADSAVDQAALADSVRQEMLHC